VTIRLYLVESWKSAYKWLSIQCAVLLGVLLSIQASLKDSAGDLAALTQSRYWSVGMTGLAALTILLRLVRQQPIDAPVPVPATPAVSVMLQSPVVLSPIPEGVTMPANANALSILSVLPALILAAEEAEPSGGSGADKAAAVLAAVTPMIPDELAPKVLPQVKAWITMLVGMYNARQVFAKK
jgi:hypothetical protein